MTTAWQRARSGAWALVAPGEYGLTLATEEGEWRNIGDGVRAVATLAECATDHAIFTAHWREVMMRTGLERWTVKQRRGRALELITEHRVTRHRDALRVRVIPRAAFPTLADAPFAFGAYLAWLRVHGVHVDPARATWYGLNRQLVENVTGWPRFAHRVFSAPDQLAQVRAGYYGSRKGGFRGRYRSCVHYDLTAAYPHALGTMEWPRRLVEYRGTETDRYNRALDPERVGIARAAVDLPSGLVHGPLPVAPADANRQLLHWPTSGHLVGWWALNELRLAWELGAIVEVHELYDDAAALRNPPMFAPWLDAVTQARALPHGAALLAKMHANSVWGMFVSTGADTIYRTYESLLPRRTATLRRVAGATFNARSYWPAAWCAAIVRRRLYVEALAPMRERAVHHDTDGVIGPWRTPPGMTIGTDPGTWKRRRMPEVEVWDAQAYRYLCPDCGAHHPSWHTVVAGLRTPAWADVLRRRRPVPIDNEEESAL